jgi:ABC-2 type transport system permease protein
MNMFLKLTLIELKLYLRNYIATFFTFAFPLLMLALFGAIYGNKPEPVFGGYGAMDITVPGYIATLIIGATAFMSLPMDLAIQRQLGVLRRMRATPLNPAAVLGSKTITNLLVTLLGTALMVAAGAAFFQAYIPANWLPVLLGTLLSCLCLFSLGFALASLVRSANAVRAVSFSIFYPMMFFSGGTIPGQFLPPAVQDIAKAMPMTYSVNLLRDLWFGKGWDLTAVAFLVGFTLAGVLVSVRFFRWE